MSDPTSPQSDHQQQQPQPTSPVVAPTPGPAHPAKPPSPPAPAIPHEPCPTSPRPEKPSPPPMTKNNDDEEEEDVPCVMRTQVDLTLRQAQWSVPSRNAPSPASGARSPDSFASTPRHVPSLSTVTKPPPPPWLTTKSVSPTSSISPQDLIESIQSLQELRNVLHIERDKTLARLQDLDARVAAAEHKIQQQLALHRKLQFAPRTNGKNSNTLLSPPQSPNDFRRQYGADDSMDVDGKGGAEVDQLELDYPDDEPSVSTRHHSSDEKRNEDEDAARDRVSELPRLHVSKSPTLSPQTNGNTLPGSVQFLHVSHLRGQSVPSHDEQRRPTPSLAVPSSNGKSQPGHQSPLELLASAAANKFEDGQKAHATRSPQPTWTAARTRLSTPARIALAQDQLDDDNDDEEYLSSTPMPTVPHKRDVSVVEEEEEEEDEVPDSDSPSLDDDDEPPLSRKRAAPKRRRLSAPHKSLAQQYTFIESSTAPAGPHRRKPQNKRHSRGGRIVCEWSAGPGMPKCGQRFTRQADMVRHRENIHGAHEGKYRCPVCAKSLSRADAVKRHVLHSDDPPHKEFQKKYSKEIDGGGDWWQALAPQWRKMTIKV